MSATQHSYFADLYASDWTHLYFRVPLFCSIAVGLCLVIGVLAGHPSAGLIAGGGAMTVGFGVNQPIADSRLWPMIAATCAMFLSTIVGMLVGHHGFTLLLAVSVWSFAYGLLTTRAKGVSWVGQQAAVILIVTSAFPADLRHAFERGLLILLGGGLQLLITSLFLNMLPELKKNLLALRTADLWRAQFKVIPKTLPEFTYELSHATSFGYAIRLTITVTLAAEVYRRLGVQSGYWIPMTALLVQKPAFYETFTRALLRVGGTLAGAVLATLFLAHIHPSPLYLAIFATICAFLAYATNTVNYGLFSLCLTSYIVFLLSLNQLPGELIAHRRAVATITGGLIALIIHADALRRHRDNNPA